MPKFGPVPAGLATSAGIGMDLTANMLPTYWPQAPHALIGFLLFSGIGLTVVPLPAWALYRLAQHFGFEFRSPVHRTLPSGLVLPRKHYTSGDKERLGEAMHELREAVTTGRNKMVSAIGRAQAGWSAGSQYSMNEDTNRTSLVIFKTDLSEADSGLAEFEQESLAFSSLLSGPGQFFKKYPSYAQELRQLAASVATNSLSNFGAPVHRLRMSVRLATPVFAKREMHAVDALSHALQPRFDDLAVMIAPFDNDVAACMNRIDDMRKALAGN